MPEPSAERRLLNTLFGPPAPGPRRRRGWLAFTLTQLCPGWGQLYNGDLRWAAYSFAITLVMAVISEIWLFDSLRKFFFAIGVGLALDLVLSVQAWWRARRIGELERKSWQRWWVYLLFLLAIYGLPDGYGLLMPSRIRSFQIPSESMVPNLLVGDRLIADGWAYWHSEPKRGDIVVFLYPKNPTQNFVKRLVGLPGDTIELKHGELFVNGKIVPQSRTSTPVAIDHGWRVTELLENLGGVEHTIHRAQPENDADFGPVTVPAESFFMMGDNRDRSSDSRAWGFVGRDALQGRMQFVYFSWDSAAYDRVREENPADLGAALYAGVRWDRIGKQVR